MDYNDNHSFQTQNETFTTVPQVKKPKFILATVLFILTLASCIFAGFSWAGTDVVDAFSIQIAVMYGVLIMVFLLAHELGHFFAARYHKIDVTLPYFLPFPLFSPFGTMGAFIKTKTPIHSKKVLFDIGVSGPLVGFIVCLLFLIIGLLTCPSIEYLYTIHPDYQYSNWDTTGLYFGDTVLFEILKHIVRAPSYLPPMNEIYHYPFLCVGWFGLFVTAMNLLPFGQLDGGHILYAMFGRKQHTIAKISWWFLLVLGLGNGFGYLYSLLQIDIPGYFFITLQDYFLPVLQWISENAAWYFMGWSGWLFWAFLSRFFIKLPHPIVEDENPIGRKRIILGWVSIVLFFLTFTYNGIYFVDTLVEKTKKTIIQLQTPNSQQQSLLQ